MKSVLLIGATGLLGSHCLDILLKEKWVGMVTVLSRRNPGINHKKLVTEIVDFEKLGKFKQRIQGDTLISTFGSTIKKAGNNKDLFYKWDVEYPLNTARIAYSNGCKQFLFVSAAGVKTNSPFFYSRCKATMEKLALEIGFESLDIFQPALFLGKRDEIRRAEKIAGQIVPVFKPLFVGPFRKYSPIQVRDLAYSIVQQAKRFEYGVRRNTWDEIMKVKE